MYDKRVKCGTGIVAPQKDNRILKLVRKAIIYTRFSPRRNADVCESAKWQNAECKKFLRKHRIPIATDSDGCELIFSDPDVSGADEAREGIWQAVNAIQPGWAIVVWKLDRLARSVYLSAVLERQISNAGGCVISASGEGTWDDSPEDKLIRDILCSFDEYVRKANNARTSIAMRRLQRNGRLVGRIPPYGSTIGPWVDQGEGRGYYRLLKHPGEQRAIDKILELAGSMGQRKIVQVLQKDHKKYPPRGKKWYERTVSRILKREQVNFEL